MLCPLSWGLQPVTKSSVGGAFSSGLQGVDQSKAIVEAKVGPKPNQVGHLVRVVEPHCPCLLDCHGVHSHISLTR